MLLEYMELSKAHTHCGMHQHNFWEICLNLSGTGTNYFEEEKTNFSQGSIYVCPPFCAHKKETKDGNFQDIYIMVSGINALFKLKNRYFTDDSNGSVKMLMLILHNVYQNRPNGYKLLMNSLTESICNMLIVFDENEETSPGVDFIKNAINNNFSDPEFKVETIMKNSNYNPDYMRRMFKKEVGVSPVSYMNNLRIEKAQKILLQNRTPGFSISEIALMSGFNDMCYFSRVFKKITGSSPTKMQK